MIDSKRDIAARASDGADASAPTAAPAQRTRAEIAALLLIVLIGSLPFIVNVAADPDLWWQIRSGELILDQGSVPQADTWSFNTEGEQWTNHEWLSGVVFAKA